MNRRQEESFFRSSLIVHRSSFIVSAGETAGEGRIPGRTPWRLSFARPCAAAAWIGMLLSPTAATDTQTTPVPANVVALRTSGKRVAEEKVRHSDNPPVPQESGVREEASRPDS